MTSRTPLSKQSHQRNTRKNFKDFFVQLDDAYDCLNFPKSLPFFSDTENAALFFVVDFLNLATRIQTISFMI